MSNNPSLCEYKKNCKQFKEGWGNKVTKKNFKNLSNNLYFIGIS